MRRISTAFVVAIICLGCDRTSPVGPGPVFGLAVSSVQPNSGPADLPNAVRITGTGFQPGATVTFAGAANATDVTFVSETVMTATTPIHTIGAVDVVVTNPTGRAARLAGGFKYELLEVLVVSPPGGYGGETAVISGSGFHRDAIVRFDSVDAAVTLATGSLINARIPVHEPGSVNVVVFNPNGTRATFQHRFTYEARPSLSVSPTEATAGTPLIVSWVAPAGRVSSDWIGIFRAGELNTAYLAYEYTGGSKTGTWTYPAPSVPGRYEFRYLLNDGYQDIMRSAVVTVSGLPSLFSLAGR